MITSGSVEYLHSHNNKPFVRGGDFTQRKALGEQPMQLQYSRAFGVFFKKIQK
jgi:protein phosphatase 2C family protein 2/3